MFVSVLVSVVQVVSVSVSVFVSMSVFVPASVMKKKSSASCVPVCLKRYAV